MKLFIFIGWMYQNYFERIKYIYIDYFNIIIYILNMKIV
jgi:hypothetical protein